MGIVASLAAAPAAYDIIQDERIRDQERLIEEDEHLKKLKDAELYKLGDVELDLIKRYQLSNYHQSKQNCRIKMLILLSDFTRCIFDQVVQRNN